MPEILGTILPLTALSNPNMSRSVFDAAYEFLDWLSTTNQQAWQFLPLHPTAWKESNLFVSPYTGDGVGLNPLFVPESLESDLPVANPGFVSQNKYWLDDFCLFQALSDHFDTDKWFTWPLPIRSYDKKAVAEWASKLEERIDYYRRQQSMVHMEFGRLKQKATDKNILLIGDIPYYLHVRSPLVWANQKCFLIDDQGNLPYTSGAPVGKHFARQVWGLPLYDWNQKDLVINLMKLRLLYAASLYDWARIDAAMQIYTYGKVHPTNISKDETCTGPGEPVFRTLVEYCKHLGLQVFVEDVSRFDMSLLHQAMAKYDVPGISVFTFGLTPQDTEIDRNHFNPDQLHTGRIFHTSNHDSLTLLGYIEGLSEDHKQIFNTTFGLPPSKNAYDMAVRVRNHLYTHARRLIMPVQDWLLTTDRINTPGTIGPHNWSYVLHIPPTQLPTSVF